MPTKRKSTIEADNAPLTNPADSNANAVSAPVKRQRVSRACDQCRAARENPKKRGVQTGYIKTLEVALAWLFDKVPGTEDALENLLVHDASQSQSLLAGNESEKSNRLHKIWRKSKVQKEIDRILSGGQARAQKLSPSDNDESDTAQRDKAEPTKVQGAPRAPRAEPPTPLETKSPSNIGAVHEGPTTAPRLIKLPPDHWRLLDIYFSYTHCWFPILDKQDLLKMVYLYPSEGLDILRANTASASHAELWAALALASYQDASSGISTIRYASTGLNQSPDELYNIARRLIPSEEGAFDIQHARALLLLALINIGKGKESCAWIQVGLAHRIAVDISEHLRLDESSSRRATAVLMGCCILDTLISVHRGGILSLETAVIVEGMSISEDSLDEWQPWAPCDGFGQGPSSPAVSSRIPAYSLTTYNQLYNVFKFLGGRSLRRHGGPLHTDHPAEVIMLLHHTIKPQLPFADFITTRGSDSATIPSAYVLRILFLWATALLDSAGTSLCLLILESIEQYSSQFGMCGAPPFFASCLAMMSQHRSYGDLDQQSKDRWCLLSDSLTSIWTFSRGKSTNTTQSATGLPGATRVSDTPVASSVVHMSKNIPTTTSPNFYSINAIQSPNLPAKYHSANSVPSIVGTFPPSKPVLNTGADPVAAATNINTRDTHSVMHGGTGPQIGRFQQHAMVPEHGYTYHESTGGAPLDYDALLDNLSSMDYLDRVDADPQFMANLGFAPGADMTEFLSRDFGTI
ncbi:hypothetical protein VPNG_08874 [Cytospora leucostoma]|uniref:Xylanolytic transcriptional activator regulatory domain-containing protein n=1 Tax=Cytospora leucostoma TaxID=1230097 RepID=A0A423VRL8_9PEZI|nr:hypothetical protein VPNG_08874 [Cytospora leucostoma]